MGSLCSKESNNPSVKEEEQKLNDTEVDLEADDSKCDFSDCKHEINEDGSVSFYPSPHLKESDLGTTLLDKTSFLKSRKLKDIKEKVKWGELEAVYDFDAEIVDDSTSNISSFILGAIKAFNKHYPFKISPNNIFLLILQAIAINVDKNAEKLRNKYVTHDGKMTLTVERDSETFIMRQQKRDNDWNSVIQEFVQQINANTLPDTTKLMEADFSDSNLIDIISNKICVMDICKNYFKYEFRCFPACGFPKITLSGNKNDWINLKKKTEKLLSSKVDKKWGQNWKTALLPLLDRFIDAFDGKIDGLFWNSMIKFGVTEHEIHTSGGGGPVYLRDEWFSGWFNILFPYICENDGEFTDNEYCERFTKKQDYAQKVDDAGKRGNDLKVYPIGLSSAPVKTMYVDASTGKRYDYQMKFISGIIGYDQCPKTFEIQPVTGWMIVYED